MFELGTLARLRWTTGLPAYGWDSCGLLSPGAQRAGENISFFF